MLNQIMWLCCFLLICNQTFAEGKQLHLYCQDKKYELSKIHQLADGVVLRKSEHELQINVAGKTLKYVDNPPYDETGNNNQYYFCDRKEGFILITNNDYPFFFSGLLINEKTGQVTSAGEEVIFSIDRRAYFIQEQPDGLDGSLWKIYAVKGNLSWSGYSYIPRNGDPNNAEAYLSAPKWKENGEFTAMAECMPSFEKNAPPPKKWLVTLKSIGDDWGWYPKKRCP